MNELHPEVAPTIPPRRYNDTLRAETHVEIVDEAGFAGYDPTSKDILAAYEAIHGHHPHSTEELIEYGNLVLRTAKYYGELFKEGEEEVMLFGLDTQELQDVGGALSLDTHHAREVFPALSVLRRTVEQER